MAKVPLKNATPREVKDLSSPNVVKKIWADAARMTRKESPRRSTAPPTCGPLRRLTRGTPSRRCVTYGLRESRYLPDRQFCWPRVLHAL